ncbi:hypothetical protein [Rickettsiales endosymbiont of Stachyamoeba lipophora]|uniref:hypothetical protein n=1 Tax=Rickettsiales endosymbiont of Stachyamoeba lipophora TaxID=2486578 RepID=UPI000F647FA7|nr:hypothetical protein [Rickettsiales endosymbiont of Stachyamoeba lipophora]AZL16337.1 hypothetical protein EF513_07350 [Rickettsiales endosymbiont of Stachyamoeba lipophora]
MKDHIIELFYKAEDFFFSNISKEIIKIDDKTVAYITGVDSAGLNPIIQRDFIISPNSSLNKVVEIYNSYNLPWIWIV